MIMLPGPGAPARPGRLLLALDSLDVGGAERHVVDLALALRRGGYEVTVACSVTGSLSGPLEKAGVQVRPLMDRLVKRRVSPRYARKLRMLVKRGRFDLVHAHIYASEAAAAVATLGTGVPLVVTQHTEVRWQGRGARFVNRWFCRRAERVIAVSSIIRRRLVERDGVPAGRIAVIPNAVPAAEEPLQAPPLPAGLREGPLVGVVARLQPEKGVADFLKAAARIAPRVPEARFVVAGDGPLRKEIEALAGRLAVSDRVHFLGFRSDARAITEILDVLAVPSRTEGAPLVVLEAMAAGVPVVASAVGGIPDQIRDGEEGLLVPPGDPTALGDAILGLLQDAGRTRRMGEAGRRRAATEFSHATMVGRIEAVYRDVLGLPSAPTGAAEEAEVPVAP